ncbi:hypothetical protein, variant 1 [Fonticula alba]|uniref:VWFA domain-containing protein n=1 Tax=Fonticula alba TaxID=691883 RepID=A0A058ZBI2_FONAL|nr:hypothetical protein, variant 1 [Fonticula alba]KCV71759.1 hypothetical protein, variant 1 [Fonticula alba]|eukprot:XP_009493336.1 hypothetical protein, variant 1 [Fonticula alba]
MSASGDDVFVDVSHDDEGDTNDASSSAAHGEGGSYQRKQAWEADYQKTWDGGKEKSAETEALLKKRQRQQALVNNRLTRIRLSNEEVLASRNPIRRALLRRVLLVVDLSESMAIRDAPSLTSGASASSSAHAGTGSTRLGYVLHELERFTREFRERNPLASIGLAVAGGGVGGNAAAAIAGGSGGASAEVLVSVGSPAADLISSLRSLQPSASAHSTMAFASSVYAPQGEFSAEAALRLALRELAPNQAGVEMLWPNGAGAPPDAHAPPQHRDYVSREVLFVVSSLSSCDSGDVFSAAESLRKAGVRVSFVALSAETRLFRFIAEQTRGQHSVVSNFSAPPSSYHGSDVSRMYAHLPPSLAVLNEDEAAADEDGDDGTLAALLMAHVEPPPFLGPPAGTTPTAPGSPTAATSPDTPSEQESVVLPGRGFLPALPLGQPPAARSPDAEALAAALDPLREFVDVNDLFGPLMEIGFPQERATPAGAMCVCHQRPVPAPAPNQKDSVDPVTGHNGFDCPRCGALLCALGAGALTSSLAATGATSDAGGGGAASALGTVSGIARCPVCCLSLLAAAPHLARAYHHLFPASATFRVTCVESRCAFRRTGREAGAHFTLAPTFRV